MSEPQPKSSGSNYESTPLTRPEYIAAVVHLYRGELHRATMWRMRLDNTTNWAIVTTAGLLTFSFGDRANSHWVLLLGMLLVAVLMGYEARRFRLFDVWRSRVRKIEENFYGPILRRDPVSPEKEWAERVAQDLFAPRFKMSRMAALKARFSRNYSVVFGVLVLAWAMKVAQHSEAPHGWDQICAYLEAGTLPWWSAFVYLGVLIVSAACLVLFAPTDQRGEVDYWSEFASDARDLSLLDS